MPESQSERIAHAIIDAYENIQRDRKLKQFYHFFTLSLAWIYDHLQLENLLTEYLLQIPDQEFQQYREKIRSLLDLFHLPSLEYDRICDFLEENDKVISLDLNHFYEERFPAEIILNAVGQIGKRNYNFFPSFFNKYDRVIKNPKLPGILQRLIHSNQFISGLHKKKQKPFFYAFCLACLMASYRKNSLDLSAMTLDDAVAVLSADIDTLPDFDSIVSYLKNRSKDEVVSRLTASLETSLHHYGGMHVTTTMGELGYEEFLDSLTNALSVDFEYDFIYDAAEDALINFGEAAIKHFTGRINTMGDSEKVSALHIVTHIGGRSAIDFVEQFFDTFLKSNKEHLLQACETLCHKDWRYRLKPKTNKGQASIDRTYIILALLSGERSPEVTQLLKKYYQRRQEENETLRNIMTGNMSADVKPYLEAELRCKHCGDESI